MRLLIACPHCHRQYDASKLSVGERFRCGCGHVLTVQQPRSHDAAAVCCAQCGAPRSDGALKCGYCGADFTLHERDLDTVCPHCMTRVSNHARFCHFCGKPIHPETLAGKETEYTCPACGPGNLLTSRAWGEVAAAECGRCAGVWLGTASFRQLTDKAASEAANTDEFQQPSKARDPEVERASQTKLRYRPCAECGQLMVRQNFGRASGVIIDICKYHGIWFDSDELPRILDWVRTGGLARANQEQAARAQRDAALREELSGRFSLGQSDTSIVDSVATESLMTLALSGLFRRLF